MPKSKREKKTTLTKVKAKVSENKTELVDRVREVRPKLVCDLASSVLSSKTAHL